MRLYFHIGFHKTGTSWLQNIYFKNHPQIHLLNNHREPWNDPLINYLVSTPDILFSPDECRDKLNLLKDNLNVSDNIKILMVSSERLSGHPFSGGFDTIKIACRIKKSFPKASVFISIRNQIDIIPSMYKQLIAEGNTTSLKNLISNNSWKTTGFNLSYWDYYGIIKHYIEIFNLEHISLLIYEDMKNDMSFFTQDLCRKLGVQLYTPSKLNEIVNVSIPDFGLNFLRIINKFRESEMNRSPLIKANVVHRFVFTFFVKIFNKFSKENRIIDENLKNLIYKFYSPSNRKLEKLMDIKLSDKSYPI